MKRLFLAFLLIFLFGCAISPNLKESEPARKIFGEDNINIGELSSKRGVVINFVENKPPKKIDGSFYIGLNARNYLPENSDVSILVIPRRQVQGNLDSKEGIKGILTIEKALYDVDEGESSFEQSYDFAKFVGAGNKLTTSLDLDSKGDVSLGPYVLQPRFESEKIRFSLEYIYSVNSKISGKLCLADPNLREFKCPERLTESEFLGPARQMPVTITNIDKRIIAAKEGYYEVYLDFTIKNKGSGNATDSVLFNAEMKGYGIGMRCKSGQHSGDVYNELLPMRLKLEDNNALVECSGRIPAGEQIEPDLIMSLSYNYKVNLYTSEIEIIK